MSSQAFKLKYAPHFGMFKHHVGDDLLEHLRFAAGEGFTAWEDNGMRKREVGVQESVAKEMQKLKLEMGVFVATATFENVTFAGTDPAQRDAVLADMRQAVEVAKRVNAKWCTVVPGLFDLKLAWDYQTVNTIELLKRCCEILEGSGLTMVLEPLNRLTNHPRVFLAEMPQAYMICKAVNHPACKILCDLYHQQITEGNLIPNVDMSWSEIGYFQVGDNPGRKEPTTGEINYRNIFKHLHEKEWRGIVGMEHGISQPGKEGERRLIEAYREVDSF
ncbi:MAG: TIM barrel protein [Planctomycetota bacterium]|nr:TIM barrel protein [Planctomycetota bacterium]